MRHRLPELVRWLEARDFAGRVLTGAALRDAGLPEHGTLAVAVSLAEDDEPNPHGVRGRSDVAENAFGGEYAVGHGQHGGLGAYEQRPFLVLRGGGFGARAIDRPASLVDLAPTFLAHLGLAAEGVEGTPLA